MAVTQVKEIWHGRGGNDDIDAAPDVPDQNLREYRRVFRVRTDSHQTTPLVVLNTLFVGLPQIGDIYDVPVPGGTESDTAAVCVKRRAEQDQDWPRTWIVTCEYSTDTTADPLSEMPEIEWDADEYQKPFVREINNSTGIFDGEIVKNSAGDPFDPPIPIEDSRQVLVITRNEASFPTALAVKYKDAVNSDNFYGFGPGLWKMKPLRGRKDSRKFQNQIVRFWKVTYRFHHHPEGWRIKPLDQGMRKINGSRILDPANGVAVSAPVPLNGSGGVLSQGGTPVFLTNASGQGFQAYRELAYADLQLPQL